MFTGQVRGATTLSIKSQCAKAIRQCDSLYYDARHNDA
jgi:hypothetical protein